MKNAFRSCLMAHPNTQTHTHRGMLRKENKRQCAILFAYNLFCVMIAYFFIVIYGFASMHAVCLTQALISFRLQATE